MTDSKPEYSPIDAAYDLFRGTLVFLALLSVVLFTYEVLFL